jgi:mRNA interferase MazF
MKQFDEWNEVKKETGHENAPVFFKERDIFWVRVGENVGFEQNGKGDEFQRPVIIVKKYSPHMFLGIPLSTAHREGSFFYPFSFEEGENEYGTTRPA